MHGEQIQKTLDYIDENLGNRLGLSSFRRWRLCHRFTISGFCPPCEKACDGDMSGCGGLPEQPRSCQKKGGRILDIALDLGFQSHEHFTRTFKEAFGMTPEAYRRNPIPLNRMTKPQLLMNYVFLDEGVPLITDGIVLEINRCTLETPEYFVGLEKRCRSGLSRASVWNRESIRLTLCGVHFMIRKTVLMFLHVRVMSLV